MKSIINKQKPTKKEILGFIKNTLLIIIGTSLLAFGTGIFIIPFDLVIGGMSGIAIILKRVLPFDISIDLYITILTWFLFIIGFIFLGKDFSLKTLVSTIIYPPVLSLSLRLVSPNVFNGFFDLANNPAYADYAQISIVLAALFGGALIGAGCAITFVGGGSTGGTDVLAFLLCKIFKKLKSSVAIFLVDGIIVLLGMFIIDDLVLTMLGIISVLVSAIMVDKVFLGESKAFVAHIVSEKYEEINEEIIQKIDRTTTILDATGGYSKEPKKLIMVSFSMRQYMEVMRIVNTLDKNAFVTIHRAHEINGEGWTKNDDLKKEQEQ